jgi:glucose/arabinose dehydrogenase
MFKKILVVIGVLILVGILLLLVLNGRKVPAPYTPSATLSATSALTGSVENTPNGVPTTEPTDPEVTPTPQVSLPLPPPDEAAERLNVPQGFAIRIFADNLRGTPRFMTVGSDGELYVSLYGSGEIARLPDRNGDGLSDGVEIIASGLNRPHGIEWHDGWLFVAEAGRVSRLRDDNSDGLLETWELVTENIPGAGGHTSRTLHFGPDGLLYVSAGSSCNVCVEDDPRRAAILRFNPDGSIPADNPFANDTDPRKQAVWAWGLRNSVDFLWTPSGVLWANHNGRDNLLDAQDSYDSLPPEEIIIPVQGGISHGWPYCFTTVSGLNLAQDAEVLDEQSGLPLPEGFDCSNTNVVPALFTDLAHSAPLGMTLAIERLAFPAEYLNSLYVAYHGSWNTSNRCIRDCKVERIRLDGETPLGSEVFIDGWRAEGQTCGSAGTWGRPADVIVGADGALYISDDKGNRIYRVVFTGE